MTQRRYIRIIDDSAEEFKVKGALGVPSINAQAIKTAEVAIDLLRQGLGDAVSNILEVLESIAMSSDSYQVSELTFTLGLDATGSISLLSFAQGGVSAKSSMQFKVTPRLPK